MGYFMILAVIPGFFVSSLILMALWGVIDSGTRSEHLKQELERALTTTRSTL